MSKGASGEMRKRDLSKRDSLEWSRGARSGEEWELDLYTEVVVTSGLGVRSILRGRRALLSQEFPGLARVNG